MTVRKKCETFENSLLISSAAGEKSTVLLKGSGRRVRWKQQGASVHFSVYSSLDVVDVGGREIGQDSRRQAV